MANYMKYMKCKAGCPVSSQHTLFRFPRNAIRFKQWADIAGVHFEIGEKVKGLYLCGRHFKRNQFRNESRTTIVHGATPSITRMQLESDGLPASPHCAAASNAVDFADSSSLTDSFVVPPELDESGMVTSTPAKTSCVVKLTYPPTVVTDGSLSMGPHCEEGAVLPAVESVLSQGETVSTSRPIAGSSLKKKKEKSLLKQLNCTRYNHMTPRKKFLIGICQKRERSLKELRVKYKNAKLSLEQLTSVTSEPLKCVELLSKSMSYTSAQFVASQIRCSSQKPKGRRWTKENKLLALALFKRSPKCYALLRAIFALPNKKTLIKMVNMVPFLPGIDQRVFSALAQSVGALTDLDRSCLLMIDEMSIREHLQYDAKSDRIIGLEDLGSLGRSQQVANHAVVFMLRGLRRPWKQPVAFFFSHGGMDAEKMVMVIKGVLAACTDCGLNVVATVTDMGTNNVRAFKSMGAYPSAPYFMHGTKKIFTLFDPPHLLKCLRNMLLKHNVKLCINVGGKEIKGCARWHYIQEAHRIDMIQPLFNNLDKLTKDHLNPNGYLTMRVSIAAQTLSHSVAATISCLVQNGALTSDALHTAQFVGFADKLFDSVNGSAVEPSGAKGLKCQLRVEREDLHLDFWRLAVKEIDGWKFDRRMSATLPTNADASADFVVFRPPCQDGWITTLTALPLLWAELKKMGFLNLELRALNQDALENLFGSVRQQCGSNSNPTTHQFVAALKGCIINGLAFKDLQGQNCEAEANPGHLLNDLGEFLSGGMEALQTAISYWEDALESYGTRAAAAAGGASGDAAVPARPLAVTTAEEAEFSRELHNLLDSAYKLQDECELLFLDQRSVLFREDTSSVREWVAGSGRAAPGGSSTGGSRRGHLSRGDSDRRTNITGASSSPDSFASAQDEVADLREFEAFAEVFTDYDNFPLYQTALKQLENGGIPYRCLRTEAVNCVSNVEYLGKLYCIRLGFQYLFRQPSTWVWFADTGQQILTDLLLFADKDPKDFLIAYEDMLSFLQSLGGRDGPQANFHNSANSKEIEERSSSQQYSNTTTWADVEEELATRGVKAMTFFDVVLDYIMLDAFEDLDDPPSSVTAVVQNRWLSSGFKETALATAVWSLLKAKRHRLNQPNGFMAHFYAISEHISPLMAWGFLGTDEELRGICQFFKDQVMGFLQDIFSFQRTRYTSVEELAVDVMDHAKSRADGIMEKLAAPAEPSILDTTLTPSPQILAELASQSSIGISDGKI